MARVPRPSPPKYVPPPMRKHCTIALPANHTLDQLVDAVVARAPDYGFNAAATRGFLDGVASCYPVQFKLVKVTEAVERLGYGITSGQ